MDGRRLKTERRHETYSVQTKGRRIIASVRDGFGEEAENAALIAAAPELYEACKLIIYSYENADVVPEALNLAYAAVAKAESAGVA